MIRRYKEDENEKKREEDEKKKPFINISKMFKLINNLNIIFKFRLKAFIKKYICLNIRSKSIFTDKLIQKDISQVIITTYHKK